MVALVSGGLATERGQESPSVFPTPSSGTLFLARRHRLQGFLLRHRDSLGLSPEVVEYLEKDRIERAQQGLSQWASSIALARLLQKHTIPFLIFKGRALTMLTCAEADGRGGGDVDLLVPPSWVKRTHQLLKAEGYQPVYAVEPRTRWGWALVTFRNREMPYRSFEVEIDLHWRISTERDFLPPAEVLIARGLTLGHEGQEIPTLSPTDALASCAFHIYYDHASPIRRLIDFVRLKALVDHSALRQLPRRTQQLVSDVAGLCRTVFGEEAIEYEHLGQSNERNVRYLEELFWSGTGGFSHQHRMSHPVGRAIANFSHLSKYSSTPALISRLIARGLVWFPHSSGGQAGWGIPRALAAQISRVFRGRFDSDV